MKNKFLIGISVLIILISRVSADAQILWDVFGTVTAFRNITLNNVKIESSKSGEIAYSDSTGQFVIRSFNNDILRVKANGFAEKKIRVRKSKLNNINLAFKVSEESFKAAVENKHISESVLRQATKISASAEGKDYSKYKNIFDLISSEIYNVRVHGTSVVNTKIRSFDSSPQVLYVVNEKIVPDISYILTDDVKSIEFIDDVGATAYGVQGANGVLKITLNFD